MSHIMHIIRLTAEDRDDGSVAFEVRHGEYVAVAKDGATSFSRRIHRVASFVQSTAVLVDEPLQVRLRPSEELRNRLIDCDYSKLSLDANLVYTIDSFDGGVARDDIGEFIVRPDGAWCLVCRIPAISLEATLWNFPLRWRRLGTLAEDDVAMLYVSVVGDDFDALLQRCRRKNGAVIYKLGRFPPRE